MDVYEFVSSDEEMPEGWLQLEVSDEEELKEEKEGEKAVAPTQVQEVSTIFRVKTIRMNGKPTPGDVYFSLMELLEVEKEKQGKRPRAHGRRSFSKAEAATIKRLCGELIYSDHAICETVVIQFLSRNHEGREVIRRLKRDQPEGWRKKLADRVRTARRNVEIE